MSKHSVTPSRPTPTVEERQFRTRRGTKALVSASDRVLLVEEAHANGDPFWTLPGGGVRPGETLPAALRRELGEELRCRSVVGPRVSRFWYAHSSLQETISTYTVFECSLVTEATPVATEGVVNLQWADPTSLPTTTLPQVRTVVASASDP